MVRFLRTFSLDEAPTAFPLHLFGATRFRVWVNGAWVHSGPARFFVEHPEFDSLDLAELLRPGENRIEVEVLFFGCSSYQTMPDDAPGFIAWGGSDSVDLATPGLWTAERVTGLDSSAPAFSFAQGPVEILDLRAAPEPTEVQPLPPESRPWGPLTPFSGRPLPFVRHDPRQMEAAGALSDKEIRFGFMVRNPGAPSAPGPDYRRPWAGFETWIHSPTNQTVDLTTFWCEVLLNGDPVSGEWSTGNRNRGRIRLELKNGWNRLQGRVEALIEAWCHPFGFDPASGISFHSHPDAGDPNRIAYGPTQPKGEISFPDGGTLPEGWVRTEGDPELLTPARMVAWDEIAAPSQDRTIRAREAVWCFSFEGEFHGHPVIEVERPPGTVADVTVDDWQQEDGLCALYRSNPFVDSTDRFILPGGRTRLDLFHPRGGKLLQVTLRAPDEADLTLHDVWVRSRNCWQDAAIPDFRCGDETMEWAWQTAFRTLISSTDDAFSDCPWRERGSYIGDSRVSMHLSFLLSDDLRTTRRTVRSLGRGGTETGLLAAVAPAWHRRPHEDFSLIWVVMLAEWVRRTGDRELADELLPVVRRMFDSPAWVSEDSGLWSLKDSHAFFDWGILPDERQGREHAGINLLRVAALEAWAELEPGSEEQARLRGEAERILHLLLGRLWREEEGRFRPDIDSDAFGIHTQVLALWLLAGRPGFETTVSRLVCSLEPRLAANLADGRTEGQHTSYLELYFFSFLLPGLARAGRPDLAEQVIRDHYGWLKSLGDDTLPECFSRADRGEGSRCHTWSGAPALYAAEFVLGLRLDDSDPDTVIFRPITAGIHRASGVWRHPRGPIRVTWAEKDGRIDAEFDAPPGVTVRRDQA
ncbi:MAG: hypothetical protein MH204_09755 [Fimbriimonadaceae bacterium]|nr:hypothetical protein [Fimbriimonadaceae bacterium]